MELGERASPCTNGEGRLVESGVALPIVELRFMGMND